MHKKINADYIKNKFDKLPPVHLPKIKSRKVFSTRRSTENNPPQLPKEPPPTVIDRSPVTLSTISSMVVGAPKYDYSFGGAEVPEEVIERHLKEDRKNRDGQTANVNRAQRLSERWSKHYKDLSEFKFKNLRGKKTVVRTTEIEVDLYKKPDDDDDDDINDHPSEHLDYDEFDVQSLPPETMDPEQQELMSPIPFIPEQEESTKTSKRPVLKSASVQDIDDIQPNTSSLYKIKSRAQTPELSPDEKNSLKPDENSRKSHRQMFDDACVRARRVVNSKLQLLKLLKNKGAENTVKEDGENIKKRSTKKCSELKKQKSPGSVEGSLESFNYSNVSLQPQRLPWRSRRMPSSDSDELPRCLRVDYSIESDDGGIERTLVATRPAPPIPPPSKSLNITSISSNKTVFAFHKVTPPMPRTTSFADLSRGHTRKPSMDSIDSDSWIPDNFKNISRPQSVLNKIDENVEPWMLNRMPGLKHLQKTRSVDIFARHEGERVFEDFDDALRNVPVIPISIPNWDCVQKPIIKQASFTRQFSDELEAKRLNIDVTKLISQFEPNQKPEAIRVTAVVETARRHIHPPTEVITNGTTAPECITQGNEKRIAAPVKITTVKEVKGLMKKGNGAKDWINRAKAARNFEPGTQVSDEVFYSFDNDTDIKKSISPPRRIIQRHVYKIDI